MTTQEQANLPVDEDASQRQFIGKWARVILVATIIWTFFQLYMSSYGVMDAIKFRAWHLGFLLVFSFLLYPSSKKSKARLQPSKIDLVLVALSIITIGYLILTYDTFIRDRYGANIFMDYIIGGLAIILLFEATRRVTGLSMTIIAAVFLLYNFIGSYLPGMFGHAGFSVERVISIMFWGGQGIFGTAIGVSATYIFVFVMFGAFLKNSGFSDFINDLALTIAGRTSGGPAKVAVIGSGLMGMMSGSAVGNVVTTGAVTIPLMKKTGYKPKFAAAVEAVASTGGLIAPPIMGAAGFIMAEFLGVPYSTVMLAAIIPAVLYYSVLLMVVHLEAKRLGLSGVAKENIPNAIVVLKEKGHLLIPLVVLIATLMTGVTPLFAAIWSLIATVIASWIRKSTRMGFSDILRSIEEGARGAVNVGIATAIVGIVIGTVTLSSIGLTIGNNVLNLAGDSVLIAAILTMVISIILGMGVPATAAYIIVATISIPILTRMGVPPIAAHMFAFYYAALSSITPPVALASYAAAGLAKVNPNAVSIESVRLGLVAFIIPFYFLFNPLLLFDGHSVWASIGAGLIALMGGGALSIAIAGYLLDRITIIERLLYGAAGLLVIDTSGFTDLIGFAMLLLLFLFHLRKVKESGVSFKLAQAKK
ncbi:TRAP transporter permease [Psychrobacillus sp. FSL W7-1457]|uniref:TRAP transporter permease n=1 Tax=Psychrobacillus sp. FSL W7-1457 TaxID=2954547 RepID=UPI00315A96DC